MEISLGSSKSETKVPAAANVQQSTPSESSGLSLIWIYIGLPILIIIVFLAYVEIKRKKSHAELMSQLKNQNSLSLRNYVVANLRNGYGKDQIRNALAKNNYSSKEIEDAFKGLK